jgi:LacI family transcriptional regulator
MSGKATVETIALEASVSRATVSRVLNNHPNVSADVRQRVLAVMEKQEYHPNAMARSLAGKRTLNIGVVVFGLQPNYLSHGVFSEVLLGIQEALCDSDYDILLYSAKGDADEAFCHRILAKSQVDGLIAMGELLRGRHLELLSSGGLPVVTVGRKDGPPVPYVSVDNIHGAYLGTRHLLQLGHRRVGVIRGLPGLQPGIDRQVGYQKALDEAGIPYDPTLVVFGSASRDHGRQALADLLAAPEPPTAVFGYSDPVTIGAMEAAIARGLRIPEDLAFVGFDDTLAAAMVQPPLTTVRQDKLELGRQAVRTLLGMLGGQAPMTGGILLDPELVIRESCGAVRKGVAAPQHRG